MTGSLFSLLAAFILVAANGFFVLAEFAIVKVRRTRLEELANQGVGTAKVALKISHSLDSYLSAIQLGITLASLALGWLGQPAIIKILSPFFGKIMSSNPVLTNTISIVVAFSIITLMHVVLGELVPKSMAIQRSEKMALIVAWPLFIFHKITYPLVYIFDRIAAACLTLIGMPPGKDHEQSHTEEEIRMIVSASYNDGVLTDTEGQILDNVLVFADKTVHEIMVPRTEMLCIYVDDGYEKGLKDVLESNHTRFPLCIEDKDNIVGMIHLRDILENQSGKSPVKDMLKLKREVLFIPETSNLSTVLHTMRQKRIHLAIVVDEYGGTAGMVSLEDILEEIVGDIQDEYDFLEEVDAEEIGESIYEISGQMLQGDVEKLLGVNLGDQDDETIGGILFSNLGRKPEVGDFMEICGYIFEIISVDNLRIDKIKVAPVMLISDEGPICNVAISEVAPKGGATEANNAGDIVKDIRKNNK